MVHLWFQHLKCLHSIQQRVLCSLCEDCEENQMGCEVPALNIHISRAHYCQDWLLCTAQIQSLSSFCLLLEMVGWFIALFPIYTWFMQFVFQFSIMTFFAGKSGWCNLPKCTSGMFFKLTWHWCYTYSPYWIQDIL